MLPYIYIYIHEYCGQTQSQSVSLLMGYFLYGSSIVVYKAQSKHTSVFFDSLQKLETSISTLTWEKALETNFAYTICDQNIELSVWRFFNFSNHKLVWPKSKVKFLCRFVNQSQLTHSLEAQCGSPNTAEYRHISQIIRE